VAFYSAPFTFDFSASLIQVDDGVVDVNVLDLYASTRDARASEEGIQYDAIAYGTGLVALGGGVQIGITVLLLGGWQLRFAPGAYIARVTNGNLVGGPGGDPIAYSAGVQVLLIQSAAATVVTVSGSGGGDAPTAAENAQAVWTHGVRGLTQDIAQQVLDKSIMGAQTPGSVGSALQDTHGRVAGAL